MDLLKYLGRNKKHISSILWVLRFVNLVIVFALIYFAWGVINEEQAWTNISSWLVWTIWWPFIAFQVILGARLWCGICHMKLIADAADRFGLHLKVPEKIKKFGPTMGIAMFAIFLLHASIVFYDVEKFPHLLAIYLIILMTYTLLIALIFERHAFCRYFCPLAGILSNYTRCSPTELRPANPEKCKECTAKACVKNCPHNLYIGTMDSYWQEACLLCMKCVKHCPYDNIVFRTRKFFKGIFDSSKRTSAGTVAVIVILGLLIGEYGEMTWSTLDNFNLVIPNTIASFTGIKSIFNIDIGVKGYDNGFHLWESIWVFLIQPSIIIGLCGLAARTLIKRKKGIWSIIKIYAIGFLPLILITHIAMQFSMANEHLFYLPYILGDLRGETTASGIASGTIPQPPSLVPISIEMMFYMSYILLGIFASLYVLWKISKINFEDEPEEGKKSVIPFMVMVVVLGIVFLSAVYFSDLMYIPKTD